ncbi:MAG: outer membrane beta-barrel protein [Bacteroidales bacterium]
MLFSQEKYCHGYILLDNADTVHLLIDDQGDIQNAIRIRTKTLWDPPQEKFYYPHEIEAFSIFPGRYYVSEEVDGKFLFLRALVLGNLNLLVQRTPEQRENVYLQRGKALILLYSQDKAYLTDRIGKHHDKVLLKKVIDARLDSAFADCEKVRKRVPFIAFKLMEIARLVKSYNECSGNSGFVDLGLYSNQPVTRISFFAGMMLSRVEIREQGKTYFEQSEFKNRPGIRAGICFDLHYRSWSTGLSMQFVAAFQQKGMSTVKDNSYTKVAGIPPVPLEIKFKLDYISLGVMLKYRWTERKLSPYLSGGLLAGHLINSFNKAFVALEDGQQASYIFNQNNESPAEAGFHLQFGLNYRINSNRQIFAGLSYENTAHVGLSESYFTNRSGGFILGMTF